MLVQGLEDFKAVRIAAGDGVSMAISDKGEVRSWGCFRVRSLVSAWFGKVKLMALPRIKMASSASIAFQVMPKFKSSLSVFPTWTNMRQYRLFRARTTSLC